MSRPPRQSNRELLEKIHGKLRALDPVEMTALESRLHRLRAFEQLVLDARILRIDGSTSRTQLAVDAGLGGPQAAQLERKMLVRVLGILHNAKRNGDQP